MWNWIHFSLISVKVSGDDVIMIAIVFYIKIKPTPANVALYDAVGDLEDEK